MVSAMVVLAAHPTAAQLPDRQVAYSADSVVEFGDDRLVGKSFHDRGRERHELSIDGFDQITILRPDLGRAFVIQPAAGSLIELSIAEAVILPPISTLYRYEAKKVGRETIRGERTARFQLTNPQEMFGPTELTVWITDDAIVVRMESEIEVEGELRKVVLEHRNVVRGDLDPVLFDPLYQAVSEDSAQPASLPETMGKDGP